MSYKIPISYKICIELEYDRKEDIGKAKTLASLAERKLEESAFSSKMEAIIREAITEVLSER